MPTRLDTYDYTTNKWSRSANAPQALNHFQATEYQGLIWGVGSFRDNRFPNELPAIRVYIYDPANNAWMLGPQIPRPRGGGGLGLYQGKFYLVAGNTKGHAGGFVPWLDEYNPRTGQWQTLADAPRSRDHFHAAVVGDRLYAAGGRRTTKDDIFGDTIAGVDVYDITNGEWMNANLPDDLPIPRAASATAVLDGRVVIMGGESSTQEVAHKEVHALNVTTGTWSTLASMNHGRHGTQAITSGRGIYVAGGSPVRGAGNQRNMEEYNADIPTGEDSVAGKLSGPASVEVSIGESTVVPIQHVGGNQGVFVNSMILVGEAESDFTITSDAAEQFLIGRQEQIEARVEYTGTTNGAKAELAVTYSNLNVLRIELVAKEPPQPTSTTATPDLIQNTTTTTPPAQPVPISTAKPKSLFFANTGVVGENVSIITGKTNRFGNDIAIGGTETPEFFQTHRWGRISHMPFATLCPEACTKSMLASPRFTSQTVALESGSLT